MTPRYEFRNVKIRHEALGFDIDLDLGIIREPTYDLIIGIDFMDAVGLVMGQNRSTFFLEKDLQDFFTYRRRPPLRSTS